MITLTALAAVVAVVAVIATWQAWQGRGRYRRLSTYRPDPVVEPRRELGTEGLDLDAAMRDVRRNAALENSAAPWMRTGLLTRARIEHIEPYADDETYARRYYAAYLDKTKRSPRDDR